MHAEHMGPEGVALLSGRRRDGGPSPVRHSKATCAGRASRLFRGGQPPDFTEDLHAHDFDVRIMVLGGEITVARDRKPQTSRAGDHCELPEGCANTPRR